MSEGRVHQHPNDDGKCVEIGPDVCLSPYAHGDHLAGFLISFDIPGDTAGRIPGAINVDAHFDGQRPRWQMTGSLEGGDLTLTPSVHMQSPGAPERERHGYVTNGKWVPV